MSFPSGWPPPPPQGRRSIRYFKSGTATANFSDNAYLFAQGTGANPFAAPPVVKAGQGMDPLHNGETNVTVTPELPTGLTGVPSVIWAGTIRVFNDSNADLEFSFDGVNVHGLLKMNTDMIYRHRYESGIAVRGTGAFRVEAW